MENQIRDDDVIAYRNSMNYDNDDDDNNNNDDRASDCESSVTGPTEEDRSRGLFDEDLIGLDEGDVVFMSIKSKFMLRMGDLVSDMRVVAVHKRNWSGFRVGQARLRCFGIWAQALAYEKRDGVANVARYAWYGGSKEDIARIVSLGFDHRDLHDHNSHEICLSPLEFPAQCMQDCLVDENGLRHVLLCRVLLENTESVDCGSSQFHPSSREFDSGADEFVSPAKYRICSTKMNTLILPEYVVTFTASPCLTGFSSMAQYERVLKRMPKSPWIPISALILALSKFLPPRTMNVIKKHHKDLKDRKISRLELVRRVRNLTGDDLLIAIIKSFQAKLSSN